jgi:hypothetical protein
MGKFLPSAEMDERGNYLAALAGQDELHGSLGFTRVAIPVRKGLPRSYYE